MSTPNYIKDRIAEKLNGKSKQDILTFFTRFINFGAGDNRKATIPFINWYNNVVLDNHPFTFNQFGYQWRLHLSSAFCISLGDFQTIKNEVIGHTNIHKFFKNHCIPNLDFGTKRHEGSFCSKLFHTFIPDEFPPVDSKIRQSFNFNNKWLDTDDVEKIKDGYKMYNDEYKITIDFIKKVLTDDRQLNNILRPNELSYARIIDMCFWMS